MLQDPIQFIDIRWIVERCCLLLDIAVPLSSVQIESIQHKIDQQYASGNEVDLRNIVKQLLEMMQLKDAEWIEQPSANELPMITILPGIGCRIVYGMTDHGGWLLEGPTGSQQISQVPQGAWFVSLYRHDIHNDQAPGFLKIFKEALNSRKEIFVKAGIASMLGNLFALITSMYSLQIYDRVIPTQGIQTLIVLTVGVIIVMVLDMAVKLARSAIMEDFIKAVDIEISHKIFHRLLSIRMDQFPTSVGSLASQVRSYEAIRGFASTATLYVTIDAPFGLVFLLVIMAIAGPSVAFVALGFFILSIVVGLLFRRRIEDHTRRSATVANMKLGLLVDAVDGAESIKSSGASWQMINLWDRLNRQVVGDEAQTRYYSETSSYLSGFMQQLSYVLLVGTGAWLAASSSLTTGGIVACSILSGRILAPIGMLPGLIVQWGHAKIALENIEKVFALEGDHHGINRPLCPDVLKGGYQISGLRYAYGGQNSAVSVDRLVINPGEKVAILGVIGSGKSTLLKLLAGIYKPQEGHVLLDGLDLQHISRHLITEKMGYLHQQIHLFAGTLRDNLLLGINNIPDSRIMEVSEVTGLSQVIVNHTKGLDLRIAEGGAGVSGGQKQLIAITRLILSQPNIWLLDEPTASMDDGHEQRVLAALAQAIAQEHTLVLVTHKPVLLRLATRLIILTPAGIVMDGPREEVLRKLQGGNQSPEPQSAQRGKAV